MSILIFVTFDRLRGLTGFAGFFINFELLNIRWQEEGRY